MARTYTIVNENMREDGYSETEAKVYSRLWCLHVRTNGNFAISQQQIAKQIHASDRQVRNALYKLYKDGLIDLEYRGYKQKNFYYVTDLDRYPSFIHDE